MIAERVILQSNFREQLRIEHPPKAVIGAAIGGHRKIELVLGSAFKIAQVLGVDCISTFDERSVNDFAIREQERVADIEKDVLDRAILEVPNHWAGLSTSRSVVSRSTALRE